MSRSKQALIVEDDRDIAGELKNLLHRMGFKVTLLEDPSQATDTLGTHQYEIALINMTLPEMSWRKTFLTVKNASKSTTVIMFSRSPDEDDIRVALNSGGYIVLDRPLSRDKLSNLISPRNDGLFVALRE